MKKSVKTAKGKDKERFVPLHAWCTGFEVGCVKSGKAYLRGDWVYVLTRTVYDQEGRARDLREPVYVRIGKLDRDDLWSRTRRAGKGKKKK